MGWICQSGQRRVEVGKGMIKRRADGFGKSVNGMDMFVGAT